MENKFVPKIEKKDSYTIVLMSLLFLPFLILQVFHSIVLLYTQDTSTEKYDATN